MSGFRIGKDGAVGDLQMGRGESGKGGEPGSPGGEGGARRGDEVYACAASYHLLVSYMDTRHA